MIYLIKITISLFLFIPYYCFGQSFIPNVPKTGEDYVSDLRVFKKIDDHTIISEYRYRDNRFAGTEQDITIGYRYRAHNNIKLGIFARKSYGRIHDEDWTNEYGGWEWRKTNDRDEDQIMPEINLRGLLSEFVLELRLRHIWNLEFHQQTQYTRASVTKFFFSGGKPLLNISLRYEWFFPTNYSEKEINEQWAYLDILYHVNQILRFGLFFAAGEQIWTPTQDFQDSFSVDYVFVEKSHIIGSAFLIYF